MLPLLNRDDEVSPLRLSEVRTAPVQQPFLRTLWQFSRPHTLIGSALCIPAIAAYAAPPGAAVLTWAFARAVAIATVPALLINIYITGLNQITDVEIDRVNKPYLPIAAGTMSLSTAIATVTLSLFGGLAIGMAALRLACGSEQLLATLVASAVVGTAYSLPPMRLKRFPLLAALCILSVRGSVINVGFYAHARAVAFGAAGPVAAAAAATTSISNAGRGIGGMLAAAAQAAAAAAGPGVMALLGLPFRDVKCGLLTLYFALFGAVIALMKDVPDVEGDRRFGIPSFSVTVGQDAVFKGSRRLMMLVFAGASATLLTAAYRAVAFPLIAAARGAVGLVAAGGVQLMRTRAREVDPKDPKQVYSYYMFLWKLFYTSYLLLPLAR